MTLTLTTAVVAFLAMVLGEWWRAGVSGTSKDAPIAQATGIALVMATSWPDGSGPAHGELGWLVGLTGPLALALAAVLVVGLVRRPGASILKDLGRCLASVAAAGLLARLPGPAGHTLLGRVEDPGADAGVVAVLLLIVAGMAVWVPLAGRTVVRLTRDSGVLAPRPLGELQRSGVLPLATATTAAVMAISLPVLGPVALILFLVPMAVLLPAETRQRSVRAAQQQTLVALAGLTDRAGFTAPGHAVRVAALAVPVAREVGVVDEDLQDVETVALLHDVGQVGLDRPIPGGATTEISLRDQRRVAGTGAAILARTAQLSRVAPMVADVGVPQHRAEDRGDVSLAARVVRVVSAYDDLTGQGARLNGAASTSTALARIVRSTPREFDADVVRALLRQLERRGDVSAPDAARLRASLHRATTTASAGSPSPGTASGSPAEQSSSREYQPGDLRQDGLPPA